MFGPMAASRARMLFYAAQFFFGGWFLLHGLNHWLEFFPRPSGSSPISYELIGALNHSGLFSIVKAIEIVTGLFLLLNRAVPLAAFVAFPVTLSIAHLNIMSNDDMFGIIVGIVAIALNGLVLLGHLDKFLPVLTFRQGDPSADGISMLMASGLPAAPAPASLRGIGQILPIVAGIVAAYGVTLWSTMDGGFRSKAHYVEVEQESSSAIPSEAAQ